MIEINDEYMSLTVDGKSIVTARFKPGSQPMLTQPDRQLMLTAWKAA
jgi:hypothetical protein